MVKITKEQFNAYEDVREYGVTNMFAVTTVGHLSGLSRDEIITIMENYGQLRKKYMRTQPIKRKLIRKKRKRTKRVKL